MRSRIGIDGQIQQTRNYDDTIVIGARERIEIYKPGGTILVAYPTTN